MCGTCLGLLVLCKGYSEKYRSKVSVNDEDECRERTLVLLLWCILS